MNENDAEKMRELVARFQTPPRKWNMNEMKNFLSYIEMPKEVIANFEKHAITGTMFLDYVNEETVRELTQSIFVIRKLKEWQSLLKQYNEYTASESVRENIDLVHEFMLLQDTDISESVKNLFKDSLQFRSLPYDPFKFELSENSLIMRNSSMTNLTAGKVKAILYPMTATSGPLAMFYEKGLSIGRHVKNNLVLQDEKVSRYHSNISFDDEANEFRIQDEGSAWGTFLQVNGPFQLKKNLLVELGSTILQVLNMEKTAKRGKLILSVVDSPDEEKKNENITIELNQNEKVYLGKAKNGKPQSEKVKYFFHDGFFSADHACISYEDNNFLIEDLNSRNGTWIRLSLEGQHSVPHVLRDKAVIRFAENTYQFRRYDENSEGKSGKCMKCKERESNTVFFPCAHRVTCNLCGSSLEKCPECQMEIEKKVELAKD